MVFIQHIFKKNLYVLDEYFSYVEAYDAVRKRVFCENTRETRDMHEISVGVCTGKCSGLLHSELR